MYQDGFGSTLAMDTFMESLLKQFWRDETGQDLIEYALLVALVATASSILLPLAVRDSVGTIYSKLNSSMVALANH